MSRRPNDVLRSWRISRRLSQDDLARILRETGEKVGLANDASKRLVQRWESGTTQTCRPLYARALEAATGLPVEALGFSTRVTGDGRGGHDVTNGSDGTQASAAPRAVTVPGNYSGVWLSRYEYHSSGRETSYVGLHYVVLLQHGTRLTVRSLPREPEGAPGSTLSMALEVDRNIATGTWREETDSTGYYQGAVYHGAIQLLVEPTGRRMNGKWVGFGKEFDVNTGPWDLTFQDVSTSAATLDAYSRPPEE